MPGLNILVSILIERTECTEPFSPLQLQVQVKNLQVLDLLEAAQAYVVALPTQMTTGCGA
jgi:hypothetical protein